jgi:ribosomal protein S17
MDTAPLTGDKRYRYNTGNQEQLELACQTLVEQEVMDKVVKINYEPEQIQRIYQKYFGIEQARQMQNHTHNWKGSTVYASLFCLEASVTDYYLHFDADMLLHQEPDYDWITQGIQLMDSIPTIAAIRPLCGPPHPDSKLFQSNSYLKKDERGFYAHKFFSMRAYLVSRQRFHQLSPIPLIWKFPPLLSRKLPKNLQPLAAKIERQLRRQKGPIQGAIESFEPMTSQRLETTSFVRADLTSTKAWTIHPAEHSAAFIEALPKLIQLIEQGQYPSGQAGHYDLQLQQWLEVIN